MYTSLQSYQVLQRDSDDKARVQLSNGEVLELAVGGPYTIEDAHNILVGDLWVLAGQSNMEGVGNLLDVEKPSPFVHSFQSREQWAVAQEPLHTLLDSPRLVHHQIIFGPESVVEVHPPDPQRIKGAGLGLTFAKERYIRTGVPIGLIPAAHGGTSMEQWDPYKRVLGDASLYGALLGRVKAVGGQIAGVLWYQGESDAYVEAVEVYQERMSALVRALREDLAQPELPFYYVQLGCFVTDNVAEIGPADGWNMMREAQRSWQAAEEQTGMVSAIDLDLDDLIHIGTHGLKRLGRRMADVADGLLAPDLASVSVENDGLLIRANYRRVRGGLCAAGRPAGFSLVSAEGDELPIIYKQNLEENSVLLHLTTPIPPGSALWYGRGHNPYCNITDAADAAIPALGPISLR